ncbi:DNA primase [Candidatus Campbellbacteria bacterium RIFCSPLOWO2_02_FULL_35_11]|uniref:DNA primase n=2 Tax=Candidatus Campbelliibacteriota TaxID=1752727 RepID=A0A1F5ELE6_9BACT|nr:MAG: DNA primase [Candidatus Campbellbacteria bacterium RIFCSPHIGHO2_12_FULL_35_10]OGD70400.1 MAG: DNA primase [Candidatus Campbellbacteria bacterium RIFCSPLOWO2_02_FULL_35_11]
MSTNTQKIKDRLNIVDVVGSYLKLDRAGANLKAPCPFHNEKTPSFFVSPDRGTYKCFGCGAGGDIFTFVEQFEGVDFPGALKLLAEKAGIELEREDPKLKNEREKLYRAMEEATLFFVGNLKSTTGPMEYLKKRGLEQKTVDKFRIGFVKDEWRNLYDYLKTRGFNDEEMEKVGLIKKAEKGYYDRFRNRIIFPLFDNSGRVVAFSGRLYEDDGKSAKYLNSPETVLFNKSRILYGYNFAKNDIRTRGFSILVEGQMDLTMSHQAGFTNTVATSGTALTGEHLSLLKRLSDKIVMAYDGDEAGLSAANKGAKLALGMGMEVKLVEISDNQDPADVILKDKSSWTKAMRATVHIIDFNLNCLLKKNLDKRQLGLEIKRKVLPLVGQLKSKIEQDYFINSIGGKAGISQQVLWDDLGNLDKDDTASVPKEIVLEKDKKNYPRRKETLREITGILFWQQSFGEPLINVQKWEEKLFDLIGEDLADKIKNLSDSFKNEIIFEAESKHIDEKNLKNRLQGAFDQLEIEILIEKKDLIKKQIESENDEDKKISLSGELLELSKKIDTVRSTNL